MKIYPTTLLSARWDVEASVDLADATVRVLIDELWYDATWVSLSVPVAANWIRTLELDLGGFDSAAAAKVLESQEPLVEVSVSGEVLVGKSTRRLDVQ